MSAHRQVGGFQLRREYCKDRFFGNSELERFHLSLSTKKEQRYNIVTWWTSDADMLSPYTYGGVISTLPSMQTSVLNIRPSLRKKENDRRNQSPRLKIIPRFHENDAWLPLHHART